MRLIIKVISTDEIVRIPILQLDDVKINEDRLTDIITFPIQEGINEDLPSFAVLSDFNLYYRVIYETDYINKKKALNEKLGSAADLNKDNFSIFDDLDISNLTLEDEIKERLGREELLENIVAENLNRCVDQSNVGNSTTISRGKVYCIMKIDEEIVQVIERNLAHHRTGDSEESHIYVSFTNYYDLVSLHNTMFGSLTLSINSSSKHNIIRYSIFFACIAANRLIYSGGFSGYSNDIVSLKFKKFYFLATVGYEHRVSLNAGGKLHYKRYRLGPYAVSDLIQGATLQNIETLARRIQYDLRKEIKEQWLGGYHYDGEMDPSFSDFDRNEENYSENVIQYNQNIEGMSKNDEEVLRRLNRVQRRMEEVTFKFMPHGIEPSRKAVLPYKHQNHIYNYREMDNRDFNKIDVRGDRYTEPNHYVEVGVEAIPARIIDQEERIGEEEEETQLISKKTGGASSSSISMIEDLPTGKNVPLFTIEEVKLWGTPRSIQFFQYAKKYKVIGNIMNLYEQLLKQMVIIMRRDKWNETVRKEWEKFIPVYLSTPDLSEYIRGTEPMFLTYNFIIWLEEEHYAKDIREKDINRLLNQLNGLFKIYEDQTKFPGFFLATLPDPLGKDKETVKKEQGNLRRWYEDKVNRVNEELQKQTAGCLIHKRDLIESAFSRHGHIYVPSQVQDTNCLIRCIVFGLSEYLRIETASNIADVVQFRQQYFPSLQVNEHIPLELLEGVANKYNLELVFYSFVAVNNQMDISDEFTNPVYLQHGVPATNRAKIQTIIQEFKIIIPDVKKQNNEERDRVLRRLLFIIHKNHAYLILKPEFVLSKAKCSLCCQWVKRDNFEKTHIFTCRYCAICRKSYSLHKNKQHICSGRPLFTRATRLNPDYEAIEQANSNSNSIPDPDSPTGKRCFMKSIKKPKRMRSEKTIYIADLEAFPDMENDEIFTTYAASILCLADLNKKEPELFYGKDAMKDFLNYLDTIEGILYFYNGSAFDNFLVIRGMVEYNKDIISSDFVKHNSRILGFRYSLKLKVRDLFLFIGCSLKKACPSWGVPSDQSKKEFEHAKVYSFESAEKHKEEVIEYLKYDVISTAHLYHNYSTTMWDCFQMDVSKAITPSQFAIQCWTSMMDEEILKQIYIPHTGKEEDDDRAAYYGGRNFFFF